MNAIIRGVISNLRGGHYWLNNIIHVIQTVVLHNNVYYLVSVESHNNNNNTCKIKLHDEDQTKIN